MTYKFTVFTAAYNRAHTLHRVYESLRAQTFRDFEWLIVDDGSTDNTEALVAGWKAGATFPIRYIRQENGGKHTAFNRGVQEARGELFLNLDSDDECDANALEVFAGVWNSIGPERQDQFCGVTALCRLPDGSILGGFPEARPRDVTTLVMNYHYGCSFQKWGFLMTSLLRRYPYPVFPGERFMPDSLIFNRMGRDGFLTRFVNIALQTYEATGGWLGLERTCPRGYRLYYRELAGMPIPLRWKLKSWVNWFRYSLYGVVKSGTRR